MVIAELIWGKDALKSYSVGKTRAKSSVTVDVLFNFAGERFLEFKLLQKQWQKKSLAKTRQRY